MKLTDLIFQIIEDHSGGVKYLELLMEVLSRHHDEPLPHLEKVDEQDLSTHIFNEIRSMKDIKVLEYNYRALNRTKYFVYTEEENFEEGT